MISSEELAKLSEIDLGAPSSTESTDVITTEHQGTPSLTNPDASSSTDYQSNEKAEEYIEKNKKKQKKKKSISEFYKN